MLTKEEWVNVYNYLASTEDSRITSIPEASRYRDDANQSIVDLRDNSVGTFTEQEKTDALVLAEDENVEVDAIEVSKQVTMRDAKDFLRRQLSKSSPNVNQIYTVIKSGVDNDPVLLKMVSNQIALMSNSLVWTLNLASPTTLDKQRYIYCVQIVIATLG